MDQVNSDKISEVYGAGKRKMLEWADREVAKKDTANKQKWCAIDAEGDVGDKGLLGVAFYSDEVQEYVLYDWKIIEMLKYHAEKGYTFVCHNAEYDTDVIFTNLGLSPIKMFYNNHYHHSSWKWHKRKPQAQIWDSLNLSGNISLSRLGKAIGLPKLPTPQRLLGKDPDKFNWKCEKHERWECEECYAIRDAEIVYRFMQQFSVLLSGWGLKVKPRIASNAVDVWKVLDRPKPIGIKDSSLDYLARMAFYGGRVETFKLGYLHNIYAADVVSMYPSVMRSTWFPDPEHLALYTYPRDMRALVGTEGVALVDITVPPMYVPPLPYTDKDRRIYPIGRFTACYTMLELRYALSLGCTINRVIKAAVTHVRIQPCTQFIDTMWAGREWAKEQKDPRQIIYKLLMNNLYGRWGTRRRTDRLIVSDVPRGYRSATSPPGDSIYNVEGHTYLTKSAELNFGHEWNNVMWAAYVTSAARVKLHQLMLLQGDALTYSDTDSIYSTRPIIGLGHGLGGLEENGNYEAMLIAQPKLYALLSRKEDMPDEWGASVCGNHNRRSCDDCRWNVRAKGVKREVALRFLHGETVEFTKPIKTKEALKSGKAAGQWIMVTKHRQYVTHRRHPMNPSALYHEYGFSDTFPPQQGPIV